MPVLRLAFPPLDSAGTVSLVVTAVLLLVLGVGRGIIGNTNVLVTALQRLGIAAAAGAARLLRGR